VLRIGWQLKRQAGGSQKILSREGLPDFVWAFHDRDEIGPKMLGRIARRTGLRPEDSWVASLVTAPSSELVDHPGRGAGEGGVEGRALRLAAA
jgi:hypothetical protein